MPHATSAPETSLPAEEAPRAPRWAWLVATFFGVGYLRPGPGTWASLVTLALWRLLAPLLGEPWRPVAAVATAAFVVLVGSPAATRVARATGRDDPSLVVIDEVAGQLLALVAVPLRWKTLLASLILFRVFDILKPPPLRRLERLPGGTGIVLDDVGAGLYALLLLQLLLHFVWVS
jgi:phosphatidylglycerophosphatase A